MADFRDDAQLDSSQVEDLRGASGGGGFGGFPGGRKGGGGLAAVIVVIAALVFGVDLTGGGGGGGLGGLSDLSNQTAGTPAADTAGVASECRTGADANTREDCRIVGTSTASRPIGNASSPRGQSYPLAKTRFFSGTIDTGCGQASAAVGPFYCPADGYVYIDLGFFDELRKLRGQGGPFAQAYVHRPRVWPPRPGPAGHHRRRTRGQGPQSGSVRTELQADCYAGVWAAHAVDTGYLEQLTMPTSPTAWTPPQRWVTTASSRRSTGRVNPEQWTHGSSAQRQHWFTTGYESGKPGSCDTSRGQV